MSKDEIDNIFSYHPPKPGQPQKYEAIRQKGKEFAQLLIEVCPPGPDRDEAIRHIRSSVMWANAAIAINE